MRIEEWKLRALEPLAGKEARENTYPIGDADLFLVAGCPLCGSDQLSRLSEVYLGGVLEFFSTSVCNECLYTFRPVSPSFQWFKRCWQQISTKKLEVFNPGTEEIRRQRYEGYYGLLAKYLGKGRALDVGASYGTGSRVFQSRGYQVEAIEPEDDRAHYIQNQLHIPVRAGSIEEVVQQNSSYDLVIFAHCLEHLDDPCFVMSHIRNLVNEPDGILYVEVPISWGHITWTDALYLTHKSNFTEENLLGLLTGSGFQVLEQVWVEHAEGDPPSLGVVLKPTDLKLPTGTAVPNTQGHTVDDLRRLYRKGLSLDRVPPLPAVLRYNVPGIEQFYWTLRLDTKRMVAPRFEGDFISFAPR